MNDYLNILVTVGLAIAGTATKSNLRKIVHRCQTHEQKSKSQKNTCTALIVAPILKDENAIATGRKWLRVSTPFVIRLPTVLQVLAKHGKIIHVVPCVGSNVKYVQYDNARSRKNALEKRFKVCVGKYGAPAAFLVRRATDRDAWAAVWAHAKPKNKRIKRSNSLIHSYSRRILHWLTM